MLLILNSFTRPNQFYADGPHQVKSSCYAEYCHAYSTLAALYFSTVNWYSCSYSLTAIAIFAYQYKSLLSFADEFLRSSRNPSQIYYSNNLS